MNVTIAETKKNSDASADRATVQPSATSVDPSARVSELRGSQERFFRYVAIDAATRLAVVKGLSGWPPADRLLSASSSSANRKQRRAAQTRKAGQ